MLVLSRRPEEKIVLPTVPAVIKVVSAQAGVVRLGIEAPAEVMVYREELVMNHKPPQSRRRKAEEFMAEYDRAHKDDLAVQHMDE